MSDRHVDQIADLYTTLRAMTDFARQLERELAAADERIAQLARELDEALELNRRLDAGRDEAVAQLTRERDEARMDEREACAKVCEDKADEFYKQDGMKWPELQQNAETGCNACAAAIRARKEGS